MRLLQSVSNFNLNSVPSKARMDVEPGGISGSLLYGQVQSGREDAASMPLRRGFMLRRALTKQE